MNPEHNAPVIHEVDENFLRVTALDFRTVDEFRHLAEAPEAFSRVSMGGPDMYTAYVERSGLVSEGSIEKFNGSTWDEVHYAAIDFPVPDYVIVRKFDEETHSLTETVEEVSDWDEGTYAQVFFTSMA